MRPNRVKQRIAEGGIAFSTYSYIADPAIVEILGLAGFDAVTIDLEHACWDLGLVQQMFVAADLAGITAVVRVPIGRLSAMLPLLDAGGHGIQIPHVKDRQTAEAAVEEVRYAPIGRRGALGMSRAARYGEVPWDEHVETSNREILLNVMIEDVEGLNNLEAIAAVPGVDLVNIGAHDLAESMGIRTPNDPAVRQAVQEAGDRLRRLGKARLAFSVGHPVLPMSLSDLRAIGAVYAAIQPSVERYLMQSLKALVAGLREEEARLSPAAV
jgi:4-hydroxy-2-oxoheptanedioate aldolase